MSRSTLTAENRNEKLNPRQLRSTGKVPATLYGKGMESLSIELDLKEFVTTYKKDRNAIFELKVGKSVYNTVVKKVQVLASKDTVLNIEFQNIRADEPVRMTVPVKFVGVSPAVKAGAELIVNLTEMEIECLPADIPSVIEVDIAPLAEVDDFITVAQVKYAQGIKPIEAKDTPVVKASTPKTAEEIEAELAAKEAAQAADKPSAE